MGSCFIVLLNFPFSITKLMALLSLKDLHEWQYTKLLLILFNHLVFAYAIVSSYIVTYNLSVLIIMSQIHSYVCLWIYKQ